MLKRYLKINGEQLPNPVEYSQNFSKVSNVFQSEAGDDLVVDVRVGKFSANLTFQVSSRWRDKLKAYTDKPSFVLTVDRENYTVRTESFDCGLEPHSEHSSNTQGYWSVSFTVKEL